MITPRFTKREARAVRFSLMHTQFCDGEISRRLALAKVEAALGTPAGPSRGRDRSALEVAVDRLLEADDVGGVVTSYRAAIDKLRKLRSRR